MVPWARVVVHPSSSLPSWAFLPSFLPSCLLFSPLFSLPSFPLSFWEVWAARFGELPRLAAVDAVDIAVADDTVAADGNKEDIHTNEEAEEDTMDTANDTWAAVAAAAELHTASAWAWDTESPSWAAFASAAFVVAEGLVPVQVSPERHAKCDARKRSTSHRRLGRMWCASFLAWIDGRREEGACFGEVTWLPTFIQIGGGIS